MPFPGGGGDTRIKLISSGNLRQPKAGDILNVKLGKNISAGGYTALINRGAGVVTLTTVFPYTMLSGDIPAVGGSYPIYVVASDLGLRSDTINMLNPARVPGAPTIGTAVAGNGQAGVPFTAPADNGGAAITLYTVYALDAGGNVVGTQTATQSPVPFVGLTNGVAYAFLVAASNAVGMGPLSALSNYVTPTAVTNALPTVPDGVLLANYTTASRAFPNGMADLTSDPYPGKTSNVTANLNPGNTVNIRPLDISPTVIDLRNGMVSIAFKITPSGTFARAVANLGNCYVNLYNNASPSTTQTNYMRVVFGSLTFRSERIVSGWNVMRFPIEMFGTVGTVADVQAYLQSVRYAGIEFNHNSTNTDPFQVSVDFSKTFANPISKGMVILGFDDCRRDTYAYAYPKMKAYGFPGVLYPGAIDATLDKNNTFFMNTANVLEMQADGWQTAYQAWDTEAPTSTLEVFNGTMDQLIAFYPPKGFNGPNDGSYFSSISYGSMYQPAFDSHFRTMRDYMQFNDAASPRPDTLPPADNRKIRSYGVNTAANSATNGMIPYAKRAASMRAVGIYVWHALGAGDAKLAADGGVLTGFEALLEWLNSTEGRATVDVVTFEEAVRRWRIGAGQ